MLFIGTVRRWWFDRSRRIFRFRGGDGRWKWGDPIRLCAAVEDACPKLDDLLEVLRGGGGDEQPLPGTLGREVRDQQTAAAKELVRVARLVFGLPEFDGSGPRPAGVTDAEAVATLRRFLDWLADAAEDARPFSNCSPAVPASPAGSTTGPSPASTTPAS